MVHHGGDAIKPVAVELVLVQPPAGVTEQEPQRLPVACSQRHHMVSKGIHACGNSMAQPCASGFMDKGKAVT